MKIQDITISKYDWHIRVITDVTCNELDTLNTELNKIECPSELIKKANDEFKQCKDDIGMTYSNHSSRLTLLIIGKTSTKELFINTLAHEIYHFIYLITTINMINDTELKAILTGNFSMQLTDIINDTLKELK